MKETIEKIKWPNTLIPNRGETRITLDRADLQALVHRFEEMEKALTTIRNMEPYMLTDGPHATCYPAHQLANAVDYARNALNLDA